MRGDESDDEEDYIDEKESPFSRIFLMNDYLEVIEALSFSFLGNFFIL